MKHQTISLQTFLLEKAPYYVTIATVIFSHLKITFRVKRYHVSTQKVTWYITDVYIMKIYLSYLAYMPVNKRDQLKSSSPESHELQV